MRIRDNNIFHRIMIPLRLFDVDANEFISKNGHSEEEYMTELGSGVAAKTCERKFSASCLKLF
ncbi:MAG: hypothetical protein M3270_08320 [Thermoproteota archaeon]|nr:hypothetical protein [Thermoproteota archaeon]